MKKMMFSALACVAFAFSGFASNEVVETNKITSDLDVEIVEQPVADPIVGVYTCTVNVEFPDGKGGSITLTHEQKYYLVKESVGNSNCASFVNSVSERYKNVLMPR